MTPVKGPNKRAKGQGTITQRSDGRYAGALSLPSIDGSRRRKWVYGATETEVKKKLADLRKQRDNNHGDLPTGSMTLATWLDIYYTTIAIKNVKPKTAATYRSVIEQYIKPAIGRVVLDKLTPAHVRKVETLIVGTKGLSSTTAMQAHRVLAVALKYAEREGLVTKNVATLTDAPRKAPRNRTGLTLTDGMKIVQAVVGSPAEGIAPDRLASRWLAALFAGIRQGEALGLELERVGDILDLSWQLQHLPWQHGCPAIKDAPACGNSRGNECPDRKITFPRDWEHRHLERGFYLSRPKSDSGWRKIPLFGDLRPIIEFRVDVAQSEPNPHGLLWTSNQKLNKKRELAPLDGSPIDHSWDSKEWHRILERAGTRDARLHDARHLTASLLRKTGAPIEVIQKILGHSTEAMSREYMDIDVEQLTLALTRATAVYELER